MQKRLPVWLLIVFTLAGEGYAQDHRNDFFHWSELPSLPPVSDQQEALGVAGPFVGVHNGVLVIAGGANFPLPSWENEKVWHDTIHVLKKTPHGTYQWIDGGTLKSPIAYGASVSTSQGLVCMGGNDSTRTSRDVFLLQWNDQTQTVHQKNLPSLPQPCAYGSATLIDNTIYLAGGSSGHDVKTAMKNFWSLDLTEQNTNNFAWHELPPWPGPERAFNITVAQHNGETDCVYVISGRKADGQNGMAPLTDVYEFTPSRYTTHKAAWKRCADVPQPVMAGPGVAVGQSHIFVFGGDDGSLFAQANQLKTLHPGFPKTIFAYHTITGTWIRAGQTPQTHVTTPITKWDGAVIIASGEIKPRIRSPKIWKATLQKQTPSFGFINTTTVLIYLLAITWIGLYFAKRNQTTDDFFRGGQRVPWWAAGMSIFATLLSSITYIAIPAKAFATDWVLFLINVAIVLNAPFIVYWILPFFRRIDATSAYEYLEKRFNIAIRLFASLSFVVFQIGRMAIVLFLPSLAMATITPFSVETCIVLMGGISIIYCTLGGIEAVIWTDTVQTGILLGGACISLFVILTQIDGGISGFITTAWAHQKFHAFNWDWSETSYMTMAFWVVLIGGIGQQLVPYASDQSVVQRYMSVATQKQAERTTWMSALITLPATILFFSVGTALFVFYTNFPERLDPSFQTDAVFPLFIARELPPGIAGMVVAGILAAAQSTISTSMNSTSTVIVTDFIRRFHLVESEKTYLFLARLLTFSLGCCGTLLALLFAVTDVKSMWDSFMKMIGLFGGPLCGLFLLGIFTRRGNGLGAIAGAGVGAVGLAFIQQMTRIHFLLYASLGIGLCFITGYLISIIFPASSKPLDGLTIHTQQEY